MCDDDDGDDDVDDNRTSAERQHGKLWAPGTRRDSSQTAT